MRVSLGMDESKTQEHAKTKEERGKKLAKQEISMTKESKAIETDLRMKIGLKSQNLGKGRERKQQEIGVRRLRALFTSRVGIPFQTLLYCPT